MQSRAKCWVFVSLLFLTQTLGCGNKPPARSVSVPSQQQGQPKGSRVTQQERSTPAPIPPGIKTVEITAPQAAKAIWNGWNGKYVMFIHRSKPAAALKDLEGRQLMCAVIETDMSIVGDLTKLCEAGGIKFAIGIQNNPEYYGKQLLESADNVGIMVPAVADYYHFHENQKLVEVVIRL